MWDVIQGVGGVLAIALPTWALITWLYRRSRFPRNELWYELTSMPVLNVRGSGVELSIDGHSLDEPFKATLHVWSTGTADMPTAAFDNDVPVTLTLDRPMLGDVGFMETTGSNVRAAQADECSLVFGPGLVRKNYRASWTFVTEGIATVQDEHALFGATLQSAAQAERSSSRKDAFMGGLVLLMIGSLVAVVGAVIASVFLPDVREFMRTWAAAGFLPAGLALGSLIALSSVPTRWDRAQKKRGASRFAKYGGDAINPQARYHSS